MKGQTRESVAVHILVIRLSGARAVWQYCIPVNPNKYYRNETVPSFQIQQCETKAAFNASSNLTSYVLFPWYRRGKTIRIIVTDGKNHLELNN